MKIVFIGCVHSSAVFLKSLLSVDAVDIVGVVTRKASSFNTDFESLSKIAQQAGLDCLEMDGEKQSTLCSWVAERAPDMVFCFGWSYLLPKALLDIPPQGSVGYHPAALPKNRGRHPIIWTLVLGLEQTASSFFRLEEEADTGALLSQVAVPVSQQDTAQSLYDKLLKVGEQQLVALAIDLAEGKAQEVPQVSSEANHWRKRSKEDGEIDWRMSASNIYNLIRALTHPYPGAHFTAGGQEYKIWHSKLSNDGAPNIEPGKVIAQSDTSMTVKCGDGAIELLDFAESSHWKIGDYL